MNFTNLTQAVNTGWALQRTGSGGASGPSGPPAGPTPEAYDASPAPPAAASDGFTNAHGLRLIQEFEGSPRLTSRLCEGGAWELGYGVTFNLEGAPFKEGDTCTPEYADALFRNALQLFEDGVRAAVTVPLTGNAFSALVAFAYNIGLENLRSSSVLRRVNENRMSDAAACFGMWLYATKGGHKQALRGLLRRRYAEACLFLGYDWTVACSDDAISLQREIPDTLPGTDRVIYKTAFKDVLSVAQRFVLPPADELVLTQPAPPTTMRVPEAAGAGPTPPPSPVSVPVPAQVSLPPMVPPGGVRKPEAVDPAPPAQLPPRAPVPPKPVIIERQTIHPNQLPTDVDTSKNMADSTRMVGMVLVAIGSIIQVVTLRLGIGTAIGAVFFDLTRDPVVITLVVTAIVAGLGWVTKTNGKKTFAKGADQAQGALH